MPTHVRTFLKDIALSSSRSALIMITIGLVGHYTSTPRIRGATWVCARNVG